MKNIVIISLSIFVVVLSGLTFYFKSELDYERLKKNEPKIYRTSQTCEEFSDIIDYCNDSNIFKGHVLELQSL